MMTVFLNRTRLEPRPFKALLSIAVSLILGVLVMASPGTVFGQTAGAGTIAGTLMDATGAVVPGASVVVRSLDTGVERSATTNAAGIYAATLLRPGHYEVTVSKPGFAKITRQDLALQVGQILTIDFQIPLESRQETITVNTLAPLIDPQKTEVSQVVSDSLVENLPIIGRRWDNFVLLTPSVTTDGTLISYHGISGLYNNNLVDGANNNQAFFSEARGRSTVTYTYSLDSIQEFQVISNNYSAEFGQAIGGVVNAVTKSGTNSIHGDLFYYLRYPSLNALDPVAKASGIFTQPVHQQHQFGGSVGGPILKDKLFYFFTYDGARKVFPITFTSTAGFPLPCPAAVSPAQCGTANNYLKSLTGTYPREAVQDVAFGRLDYQLNSANHLSANFDLDNFHVPNGFSNASTVNNSVTANGPQITHTRFLVTNWDSTIRSNIVNNVRFQWGSDKEIQTANSGGPNVRVTGVMAYGMPGPFPRPAFPNETRWQFADNLSISKGRHLMKVGVDVNLIHEQLINLFQGGGIYTYSGSALTTFQNWVADVYGANIGDAKTGRHYTSFTQATDPITGVGKDDFYDNDYAGYFEDRWKFRPNLTLNLGLRYEIQTIPQPPRPNTSTPLLAQLDSKINTDSNNFGPRIGIAWQPLKNTVVRAGYGIFYAKTTNSTFYADRVENGIYQQQFNCGPTSSCAPLFPNLIFTPPGPAPQAPFSGALAPQVINTNPPLGVLATHGLANDFVNPLAHEGQLTVERQLPGNLSLSVGYIFSRTLHLPIFIDANLAPATITKSYAILDASHNLVQTTTVPFYTQRLNPQTGVIETGYSVVNAWYHGLVVTVRRPLSHGVEVMVNYTYSKSIDDGAVQGFFGTFDGTDSPLDPANIKGEQGLSELDQRHRFVGSVAWAPFGTLKSEPARIFLKGFVFSTIVTEATGQRVQSNISGFPSNGVDGGVTGGVIDNSASSTGGRAPQFARNAFTGPGLNNVDFRAMREFAIHERFRLQVLGEAFNLFNETNLVLSGNTATTAYNYVKVGGTGCSATTYASTNGCLIPSPTFMSPASGTSVNGLYGPRQLQLSAKFVF